jgi:hypothetical protein
MGNCFRICLVVSLAALAGCQSVDADNIAQFGQAATAVATATQDARVVENKLAREREVQAQALQFSKGFGGYQFPPKYGAPAVTGVAWNAQIAYAAALADYGSTLAAVAKGVQGADLDKAVDNLQQATTTIIPALAGNTGFKGASSAVKFVAPKLITEEEFHRIQRAIIKAHPAIVKGSKLLSADFAIVAKQVDGDYADWQSRQDGMLEAINNNGSPAERYETYRQFLTEREDMQAAVALLVPAKPNGRPGYEELLDKMVAAHKQLAEAKPDEATIVDFVAFAEQIQALASTASKGD